MNVSTLYKQVALLGFEDSLENVNAFYYAASRAIYQVNLLRPHIAEYRIFRHTPKNLLTTNFVTHVRENDITFEATAAKAYFFEAFGSGTLFIEEMKDGAWHLIAERVFANTTFTPYKDFIKAGGEFTNRTVRLRFAAHPEGDFTYFVRNVAMFSALYSADGEDIPEIQEFTPYNMAELCSDFLSLPEPPIVTAGQTRLAAGYKVEGGSTILLPYEAEGEFKILYRRKPHEIIGDGEPEEDETQIDLDEELCTLLPLLTAAYVWAEDEPEKAEYYMNLYRERSAEIMRTKKNASPAKIINVTGW